MQRNSQAVELQGHFFKKSSAYDQEGVELVQAEGNTFSMNDWVLKYSRGYFKNFEGTILTKYRNIKSETGIANTSNSGIESIGGEGKYQFYNYNKFYHVLSVHFKKSMFTNTLYQSPDVPAADQLALGDDGQEIGADYLLTYYDKYSNYDFKFGYNKPSQNLSSELNYKIEGVYKLTDLFFIAGLGGIFSQKNDPYTDNPSGKPAISSGESSLFNSINREKNYLYAGIQYALGDYIVGLNAETVYSGRSTDKGTTISLNLRWEKNVTPPKIVRVVQEDFQSAPSYFTEGTVLKLSKSGNLVKISIGSNKQIIKGTSVHVFSPTSTEPLGAGVVIETGPDWSIVKFSSRSKQSPIEIGYIAKAY